MRVQEELLFPPEVWLECNCRHRSRALWQHHGFICLTQKGKSHCRFSEEQRASGTFLAAFLILLQTKITKFQDRNSEKVWTHAVYSKIKEPPHLNNTLKDHVNTPLKINSVYEYSGIKLPESRTQTLKEPELWQI